MGVPRSDNTKYEIKNQDIVVNMFDTYKHDDQVSILNHGAYSSGQFFLDNLTSDGIHLNDRGTYKLASNMKRYMENLIYRN